MLTDYHVHLRPDELEATPAEEFFTKENVDRYLEAARDAGIEELGVAEHIHRFQQALDIWDHPMWSQNGIDDLDEYCEFVCTTPLRLGVEMDYIPGREDRIASTLERRDFDYVVGSVHFVGERAVDDDEYDIWDESAGADAIWRRYFELLAEAAGSGLYDILAHPDLVKVWGRGRPVPDRDPRFFYEPAIEAIAESGIAVEISTAGLRKPVAELYPDPAFAAMCIEAGACFALSSDAHVPDQIGFEYEQTVATIREWGVSELAVFEGRSRRLEPLG